MKELIHKLRAAAHGRNSVTHMIDLMKQAADALELIESGPAKDSAGTEGAETSVPVDPKAGGSDALGA